VALGAFKYRENEDRRITDPQTNGDILYVRFFVLPEGELGNVPAVGAQLPDKIGEDSYDSLTGPYIVKVPERRKLEARGGQAGMYEIKITGKKLAAASGATASGGYIRLAGQVPLRGDEHVRYQTRGVAASDISSGIPRVGDALPSPELTHRAWPRCKAVRCDDLSEPGRVMVFAAWDNPIFRDEAYL
jgi:hypothetical protein